MPNLPIFQTQDQTLMLLQTKWKQEITPAIQSPLIQGQLISDISLINGVTTINHKLSRKMIGWYVVDIDASAAIYRSQPLNDKTLTLTCNTACTINLWVF